MNDVLFTIGENPPPRLDKALARNVPERAISRSRLSRMIADGAVEVNGVVATEQKARVVEGDKIVIHVPAAVESHMLPENITLEILHEDDDLIVVNKPSGMVVHPAPGSPSGTLVNALLAHCGDRLSGVGGLKRPGIVHRIDKDTTGILIVAKNREYAQLFTSLFRIRKIHKTYLGIVVGQLQKNKGTFKDELIYFDNEKKIKSIGITHYTVLDSNNNYSLLKLNPETGKKHQLRKQLLIHGSPILGDSKYTMLRNLPNKKSNLMLHAYKINFSIAGKKYNFFVDPPIVFKNTLKEKYLKNYQ